MTLPLGRFALLSLAAFAFSSAVGCTTTAAEVDAEEDEPIETALTSKTDAELKAEIESAAQGILYVSENDYPFDFVSAPLAKGERGRIDEALVRAKLAGVVDAHPDADKPLTSLVGEVRSFKEWKKQFASCGPDEDPGPEECAAMRKLDAILERNLWGEKVFYFGRAGSAGRVDGVAVTILIVGRTPQGNLAGVRTIAIWT